MAQGQVKKRSSGKPARKKRAPSQKRAVGNSIMKRTNTSLANKKTKGRFESSMVNLVEKDLIAKSARNRENLKMLKATGPALRKKTKKYGLE